MPPDLLVSCRDARICRQANDGAFCVDVPAFELGRGERVALVGESGSGKSTLLGMLSLALRPEQQGTLWIAEPGSGAVDVLAAWRSGRDDVLPRLRRRVFGYVQQTGGLLPFLSVRANMALSQDIGGLSDPEGLEALATRLGIHDVMGRRPDRISVGQRQRASIVRALSHRPAIVLADEPTASLDRANAEEVMSLLVEQATARGAALVLATHDRALLDRFEFEQVVLQSRPGGATVARRTPGATAAPPSPAEA